MKVVAGSVNGLTGAKEARVVRVSVPAVCEVVVAGDDTDHKCCIFERKIQGVE